jgi:hypothetical protein
MLPNVLTAIAKEIEQKEHYAVANPLRNPGDPGEIDQIIDLALMHPDASTSDIITLFKRRTGRVPKLRVSKILYRHYIAYKDGRDECATEARSLWKNLEDLIWAEQTALLAAAYEQLQAWLNMRSGRDLVVARLLLAEVANRLIAASEPEVRALGERLALLQRKVLPRQSVSLLRKLIYRIAEEHHLRDRSSITDRLDEMIHSLDEATGAEVATEEIDHEALEAENADLKSALFGLRQELTGLKAQIRDMQESSRTEALVELLADINSQPNGCLLDNLAQSSSIINQLLAQGWQPEPAEVEGVLYSIKMLLDYLNHLGVSPLREIGNQEKIAITDLETLTYVGREFVSAQEEKIVEFRTSGWTYKGLVISRPQALEVVQPSHSTEG